LKLFALVILTVVAMSGGMLFATTASAAPPEGQTVGKSHSNPDGGGVDKPYDAAGEDAASQGVVPPAPDGNNGCGQEKKAHETPDPEFGLDDNNGNCGPKDRDNGGGGGGGED
jgi:hypothetical protein